jgi:tyrosine-protein phosphatase YwqE
VLQQESFRFIASDAHSATYRKPGLSAAVKKAARLIGNQKAQAAVTDFPLAVLENSPMMEIV